MAPSQLKVYKPRIEQIADELLNDMVEAEIREGNFHDLFALPLPARVICMLLGSDESMYPEYKKWGDALVASLTGSAAGAEDDQMKGLYPYFMDLIDRHKQILHDAGIDEPTFENWGRELPANYVSLGLVSRVEGRRLSNDELFQICTTMITAGLLPTVVVSANSTSNRLSMIERALNLSPTLACPRAAATARRAELPVPQGERSMRPGAMMVAPFSSPWAFLPVNIV